MVVLCVVGKFLLWSTLAEAFHLILISRLFLWFAGCVKFWRKLQCCILIYIPVTRPGGLRMTFLTFRSSWDGPQSKTTLSCVVCRKISAGKKRPGPRPTTSWVLLDQQLTPCKERVYSYTRCLLHVLYEISETVPRALWSYQFGVTYIVSTFFEVAKFFQWTLNLSGRTPKKHSFFLGRLTIWDFSFPCSVFQCYCVCGSLGSHTV